MIDRPLDLNERSPDVEVVPFVPPRVAPPREQESGFSTARFAGFARRWPVRLAEEKPLRLPELDLAVTALRALPSQRALGRFAALSTKARIVPGITRSP